MKILVVLVCVCAAAITVWLASGRAEAEPSMLEPEIQAWFDDNLRDPESLQVISVQNGEGMVDGYRGVAVAFRSKNGYGGYGEPEMAMFKVKNGRAELWMKTPYVPER